MLGGQALRLGQTWEIPTCKIGHFGTCHLGKYPWEVAAWEIAFGKGSNITNSTGIFSLLFSIRRNNIISYFFEFIETHLKYRK